MYFLPLLDTHQTKKKKDLNIGLSKILQGNSVWNLDIVQYDESFDFCDVLHFFVTKNVLANMANENWYSIFMSKNSSACYTEISICIINK